MPRHPRIDVGGEIYHVINRANARQRIFENDADYFAVTDAISEIRKKCPINIYSFCLMPNHWHFAVKTLRDGDLGIFFGKLTQMVTQRWHAFHRTVGWGHLFQGRFKSFVVQTDTHFIGLAKYIEANPLRAGMVTRAEDWKWGSLFLHLNCPEIASEILANWPIEYPGDYLSDVNRPTSKAEAEHIRNSVLRGSPLGDEEWTSKTVEKYRLEHTIRSHGGRRFSRLKGT